MAVKKSFNENPALSFISPQVIEPEATGRAAGGDSAEAGRRPAAKPTIAAKPPPAAAKPKPGPGPAEGPPLKLNPLYLETRSKRLQLLIQPSLHKKLKTMADKDGRSLNDLIHAVLEQHVKDD